jgi:hypothetical protein
MCFVLASKVDTSHIIFLGKFEHSRFGAYTLNPLYLHEITPILMGMNIFGVWLNLHPKPSNGGQQNSQRHFF